MKPVVYTLIGLLTGFLLAGALLFVARLPGGQPVTLEEAPTKVPIEVHVLGAVLRPGVYMFAEGSRVQDAITAAGGLTSDADVEGMNLAAKLEDGQQLEVPRLAGGGSRAPATQPFIVVPSSTTPTASSDLININTAPAQEIEALPGIGPTLAQRVIEYRNAHGPFQRIEDIMNVPGIGPATFDQIKDLITV